MNVSMLVRSTAAAAISVLAFAAGTARADNPPPVADCGNGFTLAFRPVLEARLADATHGNVNGDGWICLNDAELIHTNGPVHLVTFIDNTVPLFAAA